MKKNRSMRLAVVLLALTLITTCFVSGTFAKYTSSTTLTGTATVAKWDITFDGNDISASANYTFDLFDTVKDSNGTDAETDVASGLIAPGTSGSFSLDIVNNSEVNAKYTVTLSENATTVPLQYSVNGTTWVDDIADLNIGETAINQGVTTAVAIQWRWVYDAAVVDGEHAGQTDVTDTALGVAARTASEEVTITATLTAWQVD